ncbi:beta-1,6-N-acetylglucosaminyltransferase [Pedobacter cryoconitis]|uniref:Peptide O-xylosyltransferase n=1 Tax=Pedobacter cryoconitis TaxID=188932 RepID=A0A7X0MI56_9SPHI|nr:beta-1,6-N-acetylglucosaminyltransferase [Pedobacter cryoconitis]MBB6498108.1 hypothetical protein [Pedobacter cryoconitis]
MRIAHIIVAHKNPAQLEKLIRAMYHPDFDFYIHLDKKVDIGPFEYLKEVPRVHFIKDRTVCNWGGFSLVEAVIKSIDEIRKTGIAYDFVNLMSGQDYPIKKVDEIYNFFDERLGYSFISYDSSRETQWWKEAEKRYKTFHFTDMDFKGKYVIQRIANKIIPNRKFPVSLNLYGGNRSCWWTISFECALYLSAFFKANPKMINFLRLTWGCDEFIIATILMNSPYQDKIVNENYRFIDWSAGEAHPKVFTESDYANIIDSSMLFARKFDLDIDAKVIGLLDANVLAVKPD